MTFRIAVNIIFSTPCTPITTTFQFTITFLETLSSSQWQCNCGLPKTKVFSQQKYLLLIEISACKHWNLILNKVVSKCRFWYLVWKKNILCFMKDYRKNRTRFGFVLSTLGTITFTVAPSSTAKLCIRRSYYFNSLLF